MGTPISLQTVVDSGGLLDVGNADLFRFTSGLVTDPQAGPEGIMKSSTEQGFYSSVDADGCGLNSVTVNAAIDAWWGSGPTWNWQDLQQAFAGTLWTVMQAVGNSQNYPNYSYTAVPWGENRSRCLPGSQVPRLGTPHTRSDPDYRPRQQHR